ncbi:ABC transporter permease [Paenibacillus sp. NFR01]|uniref:ABC transporter permease n=1 Tax=Paenibacillus sp. NFR01 TaxID=1566279 RepID=UPI0008C70562|nr:ABC transporter permease [Paenibacillus sp. NFR01]SET98888.1 ABC-type transport system, involved in lipoprotein release, permease component [Paenibacillus sp. NFR01]
MTIFDSVRLALINFWRSKVRSFLTILGVVIGTAAIVVMLSLGIGMNESFKQQVSQMGSLTLINVYPDAGVSQGMGGGSGAAKLDDKAIRAMSELKGVSVATPLIQTSAKLIAGKNVAYLSLVGIRPDAMAKLDFPIAEGRILENADTLDLVFGSQIPTSFYNPKATMGYTPIPPVDLMNEKLQMTFDMSYGDKKPTTADGQSGGSDNAKVAPLYKIKAAGVLAQTQNEKDWSVYINLDHLQKLIRENAKTENSPFAGMGQQQQGYQTAIVQVEDLKDVEPVRDKIKALGFGTSALTDVLKGMQETSKTLQMILGGIGAVSLLVAAIGITNTMVMSIYERTREIGIMKVLGCELGDIRKLFLLEAGFLGFMGGLLGLLFSLAASYLLNRFGGSAMGSLGGGGMGMGMADPSAAAAHISVVPTWLMVSSVVFATAVGLISGFYPARRAMKLSALEAIKTE